MFRQIKRDQRKPLLTCTTFKMTSIQNNQYIKVAYFGMASFDLLQDTIVLEKISIRQVTMGLSWWLRQ